MVLGCTKTKRAPTPLNQVNCVKEGTSSSKTSAKQVTIHNSQIESLSLFSIQRGKVGCIN